MKKLFKRKSRMVILAILIAVMIGVTCYATSNWTITAGSWKVSSTAVRASGSGNVTPCPSGSYSLTQKLYSRKYSKRNGEGEFEGQVLVATRTVNNSQTISDNEDYYPETKHSYKTRTFVFVSSTDFGSADSISYANLF